MVNQAKTHAGAQLPGGWEVPLARVDGKSFRSSWAISSGDIPNTTRHDEKVDGRLRPSHLTSPLASFIEGRDPAELRGPRRTGGGVELRLSSVAGCLRTRPLPGTRPHHGPAGAVYPRHNPHGRTYHAWVVLTIVALIAALGITLGWATPAGASTSWTIIPSPNVGTNQENVLSGISCFNPTDCVAVGYHYNGTTNQTLVETLSGGSSTVTPSPNVGSDQQNALYGVSCSDPTDCVAVGTYYNGTANQTLVETLSGGSWTVTPSPNVGTNQQNELFGVSCSDPTDCVAVGTYYNGTTNQTLVETLSEGSWTVTPSPNVGTNQQNELGGVSCSDPTDCVAVGDYDNTGTYQTLIETLSKGSWIVTPSPNAGNNQSNALLGVSCSDPTDCVAVGNYYNGSAGQTLVETLSKGSWIVTPSPNVGTNQQNVLYWVSCSDPSDCVAVGWYYNGSARQTLVETLSGGSWIVTPSPNQGTNDNNNLYGVSCSDPSDCVAVGSSGSTDQTLVLSHSATQGYRMVAADGGVFSFNAPFYGSTGSIHLNQPIVGMAADPLTGGYWMVAKDGGIFSFNAPFYGSEGGTPLNQPIVGMAADPLTGGYWMVAKDGGVFSFHAPFYGSTGSIHLNQPIVGMAATPDGGGYWLVAKDGGVFSFGDARFYGSMGGTPLNQPIVGMATTVHGHGYWLVAADGGVFSFGDARFFGSTGSIHLNRPVVGMAATPSGLGYWMDASDGGIFAFGDAQFFGSMGGTPLNQPVVGMSTATS